MSFPEPHHDHAECTADLLARAERTCERRGSRLTGQRRDVLNCVARSHAADVVRALALRRLFELRARAAALRIAAEVERGLSGSPWRRAHREALSTAARASWPDGLAARDADAQAHRDALGGAAWGEWLRRELVERFDEDYWRNPRTAAWMAGLVAAGRAGPEKERPPAASAAGGLVRRMEGRA